MEIPSEAYPFEKVGDLGPAYYFYTSSNCLYEVRFTHTPYLFDPRVPYSNAVYEFSIILMENPFGKEPRKDKQLSFTIAAIVEDFYKNNDEYIMIYICDSSDGRQFVRNRKFNGWFEYFRITSYLKVDKIIQDAKGERFPVTLIIKDTNPHLQQIFGEFAHLIDGLSKPRV